MAINIILALSFKDFLTLVLFCLLLYIFRFYYKYFTRSNKLPGPLPLPFIENAYLFKKDIKQLFTSLKELYGDVYEVYFAGQRIIVISHPEFIEKILIPSTKFFRRYPSYPYSEGLKEFGTSGIGVILNDNLKSWKFNRQFFIQAIQSLYSNNEYVEWISKTFHELEGYWKSLANINLSCNNLHDKNQWLFETDLSGWIQRFTNDITIALTTGEQSYSMASYYHDLISVKATPNDTLIKDSEKFLQAFKKHVLGVGYFLLLSSFLRHYAPIIKNNVKKILENRDYLFNRLETIIKNRRKEIEETPVGVKLRGDMLTSLITANTERTTITKMKYIDDEISRPMTDKEIIGNLYDAFLAGTETIPSLFCIITYYLCHFPHVKQKMLKEIETVFPQNVFHLEHDDLLKLKYCEAIIKEAGRIVPVANILPRYSDGPCEIAGYQWEAGTLFQIDVPSLHSHEDYWSDPKTFNPDRFYEECEKDDNDVKTHKITNKFSFTMFGGGLRICPGKKLGMQELLSLMVLVFRKYDIELVDMTMPLKTKAGATTRCEELLVKIKPRLKIN